MPNSIVNVFVGVDSKIVDVISPDNDVTVTIPHSLGAVPNDVTFTLLQTAAALNTWAVTSRTTSTVVLTKIENEGGDSPDPQIRVYIKRPHSIGR